MADYIDLAKELTLKDNKTVKEVYDTPSRFVNLIVPNIFIVAGLIIFGLIIGAGFSFLQESDQGKQKAKELATGAVVGFIVMFSAYWIVQIVELITGIDLPI